MYRYFDIGPAEGPLPFTGGQGGLEAWAAQVREQHLLMEVHENGARRVKENGADVCSCRWYGGCYKCYWPKTVLFWRNAAKRASCAKAIAAASAKAAPVKAAPVKAAPEKRPQISITIIVSRNSFVLISPFYYSPPVRGVPYDEIIVGLCLIKCLISGLINC